MSKHLGLAFILFTASCVAYAPDPESGPDGEGGVGTDDPATIARDGGNPPCDEVEYGCPPSPAADAHTERREQIAQLYRDILGREPDPEGLDYWVDRIATGSAQLRDVADALFHSPELLGMPDEAQIKALYRLILARQPDPEGLAQWTRELHTGMLSLFEIAEIFVRGEEFAGTAPERASYVMSDLCVLEILDSDQHNNAAEKRKAYYRETITASSPHGNYPMPILAYEGEPIRPEDLDSAIDSALNSETGDFRLAQLVRILYLTDEYDAQITHRLSQIDYWLTPNEDQYCYWSENHMILWMSSAYLLRQREGWSMDATLDRRLRHYLRIKLTHGFYEFFSTTYLPFTLAALLNLADFAEDLTIRNQAARGAEYLMKNWLLLTNDKGAIYPAAGRNYATSYTSHRENVIAWIAARTGPITTGHNYAGAFLATSTIDLRRVEASREATVDTTFSFGHSQCEHRRLHADLPRVDRTIFQWSSGGYFHPDVAHDTTWLVGCYNLESHPHFDMFRRLPGILDPWSTSFARIGATFTRSSSISTANVKIYRNQGVTLSSVEDYYPGYRGYQQWPWAAAVEDIAIWTQSGDIGPGWTVPSSMSANSHLPRVQQNANVALITYFPNLEIRTAQWLGKYVTKVFLHWPAQRFDESFEHDRWVIGRKGDSYAAVLRHETGEQNGFYYSNANRGRQMWAVVVGNRATHGSFEHFTDVIKAASTAESFKLDISKGRRVYVTSISVDGKYIHSRW